MTPHYEKRPIAELAHFAWCLLVAIKLAKFDGLASTKTNEHLFIMRWLGNAQKRKLFPKSVAPDIIWLQGMGKKYSYSANLRSKVEYIWHSSTGAIKEKNDLFRLTYLIETLKDMGWEDVRMSEKDWKNERYNYGASRRLFIKMTDIALCYSDENKLVSPFELRFCGNTDGLLTAFSDCDIKNSGLTACENYSVITVIPLL